MTGRAEGWIRRTTTGCVALLALIAGTVSYIHMHTLVALHGQPGWVASLTPLSVDGMIVAASTTLLAESRAGRRGGALPWALLVAGSIASLAANVAVAESALTGRIIAAWPSFALTASYELLTRQVRRSAPASDGQAPREAGDGHSPAPGWPCTAQRPGRDPAMALPRSANFSVRHGGGAGRPGRSGRASRRQRDRAPAWPVRTLGQACQERRTGRRVRGHQSKRSGRRRAGTATCCIARARSSRAMVTSLSCLRAGEGRVPRLLPVTHCEHAPSPIWGSDADSRTSGQIADSARVESPVLDHATSPGVPLRGRSGRFLEAGTRSWHARCR